MRKAILYIRVSTDDQAKSGNGLDAQRAKVDAWAKAHDVKICAEYCDTASGKSRNGRPELAKALTRMSQGDAEILISAKLDRLTRSVVDFGNILNAAQSGGWDLVVCDIDLDMTTPIGRMVANIVASVAQFERERISERTREGLAAIPRTGTHLDKLGNVKQPPGGVSRVPAHVVTIACLLHSQGKSLREIGEILSRDGYHGPTGGKWHPTAVSRLIARGIPEAPPR